MFYFILSTDRNYFREFFLIIRARGRLRNNQHIYFTENGKMYSIPHPDNNNAIKTYTLKEGAGDELVGHGQDGYNDDGILGKCVIDDNGIYNEFKYRYRCSHIWLDTAVVGTKLTDSHYLLGGGYYCSSIGVSTDTGTNLILNLQGHYTLTGQAKPMNYCLTIDKYYTSPLSYNMIKSINTKDEALDIASISYLSFDDAAKISFASDQTGATNFNFKDLDGRTIPFHLAFQSTLHPSQTIVAIENDTSFASESINQKSPIGESTTMHRLEGKIKLYTNQGTSTPLTGVYRSTIYVLVTPPDTI